MRGVALAVALSIASPAAEEVKDALVPDQALAGRNACFIVHDLQAGKALVAVGGANCAKPLPPCQTYDIALGLLALDNGVLIDERTTRRRTRAAAPDEPRDATLADAFARRDSDWFFDELADALKPEAVRTFLRKAEYGSAETAHGAYWRGAPAALTISTEQQVAFLTRLARGQLPANAYSMEVVRSLLVFARQPGLTVSMRTAACAGTSWAVGTLSRDGKGYVYAFSADGPLVKEEPPRETMLRLLAGAGAL